MIKLLKAAVYYPHNDIFPPIEELVTAIMTVIVVRICY